MIISRELPSDGERRPLSSSEDYKVYFYENLEKIEERLDMSEIILPNAKTNLRKTKGYKHLSEDQIRKISQICKFGYEF